MPAWNLVMYLLRSMHYIAATLDRKRCWNRFSSLFTTSQYMAPPPRHRCAPQHRRSLHFLSKAVGLREGGVGVCPDLAPVAPSPCKGATYAAATPRRHRAVWLRSLKVYVDLSCDQELTVWRCPPRAPRVGKASSPPPCSLCHMDHRICRTKIFNSYVSF